MEGNHTTLVPGDYKSFAVAIFESKSQGNLYRRVNIGKYRRHNYQWVFRIMMSCVP